MPGRLAGATAWIWFSAQGTSGTSVTGVATGALAVALLRPPASVTALSSVAETVMLALSLLPVMVTSMSWVAVPSNEVTIRWRSEARRAGREWTKRWLTVEYQNTVVALRVKLP